MFINPKSANSGTDSIQEQVAPTIIRSIISIGFKVLDISNKNMVEMIEPTNHRLNA
jgi:hypothetical protein